MAYLHGSKLVDAAKDLKGKKLYSEACQSFCVLTAGTGAQGNFNADGDADAVDGWKKAKSKGKVVKTPKIKDVPAGTFAYWTGGSHGFGHAAITIGGGKIISTDAPTWGKIGEVSIDWIATNWRNNLKFVGYVVNDGDGHQMVDKKAVKRPKVKEKALKARWTVTATKLNGRDFPSPTWGHVRVVRDKGFTIASVAKAVVGGKTWVRTVHNTWYAAEFLKRTDPPAPPPSTG